MPLWIAFILFTFFASWADPNAKQLCSGVQQCLGYKLPGCKVADTQPFEDLVYTPEVCSPFRELRNRGLDFQTPIAQTMLSSLGGKYRVLYEVSAVLPVNVQMMDYLLANMPFTAELVNAYEGTKYNIQYLESNKKRFKGDNGSNLRGTFRWIADDSAGTRKGQRHIFWGLGSAKVLLWELHGLAVIFFDIDPVDSKHMKYRLRAIVFPSNGMLNSVMRMDMFRNVAMEKMQKIVGNIESAAKRFGAGERKPIQTSTLFQNSKVMKEILQGFDAVVKKSGYYSNSQQKK